MTAPLLKITQRPAGGVTVLELSGRLVFDAGVRLFKEQVTTLVRDNQKHLLADLNKVDYVDSAGVGALVAMYLHTLRRGGQLKFLCPSERACRVLTISQLLSVFEVFENEYEAIDSFGLSPTPSSSSSAPRGRRRQT
jgi:anti-sigma B factor antagonist